MGRSASTSTSRATGRLYFSRSERWLAQDRDTCSSPLDLLPSLRASLDAGSGKFGLIAVAIITSTIVLCGEEGHASNKAHGPARPRLGVAGAGRLRGRRGWRDAGPGLRSSAPGQDPVV